MELKNLIKVHEGKFLTYYIAEYLTKNNNIKKYEFFSRRPNLEIKDVAITNPCGVGVVVISKKHDKVLLLKEFRLACNSYVYNFAGGLIDQGESVEEAAKRELFEETGVKLTKVIKTLKPGYVSPATSNEVMNLVIAEGEGEPRPSTFEEEEIEARWFSLDEAKELLENATNLSARVQMFLYYFIKMEEQS